MDRPNTPDDPPLGWNPTRRTIATVLIAGYLFLMVLAPLSNPIASRSLTGPLSDAVAPLHQALYLNHGYRFFAPEPGPTHLVHFTIEKANEDNIEGQFPDRTTEWPRLLYHRWFMLSERLYFEYNLPEESDFQASQMELAKTIDNLRSRGHFALSKQFKSELSVSAKQYESAKSRIDLLQTSIAGYLLGHFDGDRVTLSIQERVIPHPIDLATGTQLDDPRYLTTLKTIAVFELGADGNLKSLPVPDGAPLGEELR